MIMDSSTEKIENFIRPFFIETQLVLVELTVRQNRGSISIQILADKPQGGITIKDCAIVNRKICAAFEEQSFIEGHYVVEVSSPGLDRPLTTRQDFLRVIGREVKFFLSQPIEQKVEYAGRIEKVENDVVQIFSDTGGGVGIPILYINRAKQIILTSS